jgi:hypothetical protein
MKYKLLQIKDFENCNYMFASYRYSKDHGFNLEDYEVIYEGELKDDNIEVILDTLFYIFNVDHPEDFRGHSLSVSDIIWLDGKYYYVDSVGFKLIK